MRDPVADDLPLGAARVSVETRDGRMRQRTIREARGSLDAPMLDADIESKFHALAGSRLPETRGRKMVDAVWSLDRLPDTSVLATLASP